MERRNSAHGTTAAEFNPDLNNSNLAVFEGSRIPGYAGRRRLDSMDQSIGVTSAGQIPSRVRTAFAESREGLLDLFARIDTDGNGLLDQNELVTELLEMELELSVPECEAIHSIIAKGAQYIDPEGWAEFVGSAQRGDFQVAKPAPGSRIPGYAGLRRRDSMDNSVGTSSFGKVCTQLRAKLQAAGETLSKVFKEFDKDGSLTLSFDELRAGLARYGIDLNDDEFGSLFRDVDRDASGELSWDEFSGWLADDGVYLTTAAAQAAAIAKQSEKVLDAHRPRVENTTIASAKPLPKHGSTAPPTAVGASWLIGGGAQLGVAKRGW